jgi:hypothetical protein
LRSPEKTSAITITVSKADADLMRLGGKSMLIPGGDRLPPERREAVPKQPAGQASSPTRTATGGGVIPLKAGSTRATAFARDVRKTDGGSSSSTSHPASATRPTRRSDESSAPGVSPAFRYRVCSAEQVATTRIAGTYRSSKNTFRAHSARLDVRTKKLAIPASRALRACVLRLPEVATNTSIQLQCRSYGLL